MTDADTITLFHAPNTRSTGALILLEELGAPYEVHVLNMKAGEHRQPGYLALNPLGKVPTIRHRGALVTEQVAIHIYLADLFPKAGLAPAITDADRGPYLRWLVFYAACYEPGLIDKALKREPGQQAMSPYGSFECVMDTILAEVEHKSYLLGDRISAADLLWGNALRWGKLFGLLPDSDVLSGYIARVTERPAAAKVAKMDAAFAAAQEQAMAGMEAAAGAA